MRELSDRPLVCVAVAFSGGIALAGALGTVAACLLGACGLGAFVALLWRRKPAWVGLAVLALTAMAGASLLVASGTPSHADVALLPEGGQTLVGTVAGVPRYSDGVWRFVLAVQRHEHGRRQEPTRGRAYVRLRSPQALERGQRWRLTGSLRAPRGERNPGGRPEAARLAGLGVTAVLTVGASELAEYLGPGRLGPLTAHAYGAQRRALGLLERHVSGPYPGLTAAVAASVIFGVHATPPPQEISDAFRRAGTIHLLVVSGAMVSLVFAFVFLPGALGASWRRLMAERQMGWPLTGRGRVKQWPGLAAALIAIGVVVYYAVLTEGGQAVARAAVMGVCVALAFVLRRVPAVAREHGLNVDAYTLLAVAALAILVVEPTVLFQPGFQLSFAAVWAILYLTPKVEEVTPGLPRWLRVGVGGTLAAQLATFPILAWHYGQAPIGGLAANLAAVPLAAVVLFAGMATCLLAALAPWLASVAGWMTGWSTRGMIWVSSAFAAMPGASPEVAKPGWPVTIAWYAGMIALGWWLGRVAERRSTSA